MRPTVVRMPSASIRTGSFDVDTLATLKALPHLVQRHAREAPPLVRLVEQSAQAELNWMTLVRPSSLNRPGFPGELITCRPIGPILPGNGASGKPGAVQVELEAQLVRIQRGGTAMEHLKRGRGRPPTRRSSSPGASGWAAAGARADSPRITAPSSPRCSPARPPRRPRGCRRRP
jgi:hypothetical protein